MKYILVALPEELSGVEFDPEEAKIVYTGVGKINATMAAVIVAAAKDCEEIINYGTAGVLNKSLINKLSKVGVVKQRDMDARPLNDLGITPYEDNDDLSGDIKLSNTKNVLSSGDNFVTSEPELHSDLVDMEGYAIAKVAKRFEKPVVLMKYGTDFADEHSGNDWQENMSKGAEAFREWFENR